MNTIHHNRLTRHRIAIITVFGVRNRSPPSAMPGCVVRMTRSEKYDATLSSRVAMTAHVCSTVLYIKLNNCLSYVTERKLNYEIKQDDQQHYVRLYPWHQTFRMDRQGRLMPSPRCLRYGSVRNCRNKFSNGTLRRNSCVSNNFTEKENYRGSYCI